MINLKNQIEQAWDNRELLKEPAIIYAIEKVIEHLDKGELRIAEPFVTAQGDKKWLVNDWLKKAVLLYFPIRQMETMEAGPMEFYDKIPLKKLQRKGSARSATCGCKTWSISGKKCDTNAIVC